MKNRIEIAAAGLLVGDVLESGWTVVSVEIGVGTVNYRRSHKNSPHVYSSSCLKWDSMTVEREM